ncbi:class I SAM-dependent methyltransferase [Amycolatopsis anabasis]|uniref:class I SAM-dependent methyltransferase n=1 Tax=Amycolatopsis anabasis TaxID=1840409 RepID=UPI00131B4672|nr:class I SAM-dependent methyltransferase [Amycolatopsis anabasis]
MAAVDRVRELLDPDRVPGPGDDSAGYLDLLPPDAQRPRTGAQNAMHSPLVASVYERWWRPAFSRVLLGPNGPSMTDERKLARESLELDRARTVLDVCCGPGNFTRHFGETLGDDGVAVGLDVSPPMLARAVRDNTGERVAYVRADARELPFPDKTFDAVSCFAALYLVPEPFRVLDELVRVLAPGGRIAVLTSYLTEWPGVRQAELLVARLTGQKMFARTEITGVFTRHGLTEVRQRISGAAQFVSARKP